METRCQLKTIEMQDLSNLNFRGHPLISTIVMQGKYFKETFETLDWACESFTLTISPESPCFRLSTEGTNVTCSIEYPFGASVFEEFICNQPQSFRYKLALLDPVVNSLPVSGKSKLRINQVGLLFIQHMIKCDDKNAFVDFFIVPEDNE